MDALLDAARDLLDEALEGHDPLPDLDDVLERAGLPSSDEVARTQPRPTAGELDQLEAINADVRVLLDAAFDPGLQRRSHRRRRWPWISAVAAGLAVVCLGGVAAASAYLEARADRTSVSVSLLIHDRVDDRWSKAVSRTERWLDTVELEAATDPSASDHASDSSQSSDTSGVEVSDDPAVEPADAEQDAAPRKRHRASDSELAALDAEAYALLKAGDRERARERFRHIVRVGGRSEYAELAFGELFALARRGGGQQDLAKLWRAYLRRFPLGRYSDDARAGLCRRAKPSEREQCWTDYLAKHPRGAARAEAERG